MGKKRRGRVPSDEEKQRLEGQLSGLQVEGAPWIGHPRFKWKGKHYIVTMGAGPVCRFTYSAAGSSCPRGTVCSCTGGRAPRAPTAARFAVGPLLTQRHPVPTASGLSWGQPEPAALYVGTDSQAWTCEVYQPRPSQKMTFPSSPRMHFPQQLATLSKYPDTTSTEASHWARASTPIIGTFFSWNGLT